MKPGEGMEKKLEIVRPVQRQRPTLAITDPQPVPQVSVLWRTAAQAATIGIFIILMIAGLEFARPI